MKMVTNWLLSFPQNLKSVPSILKDRVFNKRVHKKVQHTCGCFHIFLLHLHLGKSLSEFSEWEKRSSSGGSSSGKAMVSTFNKANRNKTWSLWEYYKSTYIRTRRSSVIFPMYHSHLLQIEALEEFSQAYWILFGVYKMKD